MVADAITGEHFPADGAKYTSLRHASVGSNQVTDFVVWNEEEEEEEEDDGNDAVREASERLRRRRTKTENREREREKKNCIAIDPSKMDETRMRTAVFG